MRQNAYFKMAQKEENLLTHQIRSLKCIQFVENNFLLSRTMERGGERNLRLMSPSGAPGHLDWTKLAQCTTRSCILQNTIIRPLWHIIGFFLFFRQRPPVGHMGSELDQNCKCTTRPWGQQHETINRSLWYLVTEEIEEQYIVYRQTDGRPNDGQKGIA